MFVDNDNVNVMLCVMLMFALFDVIVSLAFMRLFYATFCKAPLGQFTFILSKLNLSYLYQM